jgi:hypothetical protein
MSVRKSLIWLMLATVAEVPPAVKSGDSFWPFLFPLIAISRQVFFCLNLNGDFRFSPIHYRWVFMELYSGKTTQDALDSVSPCSLRLGVEGRISISYVFPQRRCFSVPIWL